MRPNAATCAASCPAGQPHAVQQVSVSDRSMSPTAPHPPYFSSVPFLWRVSPLGGPLLRSINTTSPGGLSRWIFTSCPLLPPESRFSRRTEHASLGRQLPIVEAAAFPSLSSLRLLWPAYSVCIPLSLLAFFARCSGCLSRCSGVLRYQQTIKSSTPKECSVV